MGPKAATVKKLNHLVARHKAMVLANRYLAAGQTKRILELGLPASDIPYLLKTGGFTPRELANMRSTIRYYRTKSKRRLWLPDPGDK